MDQMLVEQNQLYYCHYMQLNKELNQSHNKTQKLIDMGK